jgi:hypothetical protein
MIESLRQSIACAQRAMDLARDLDKVRSPGDLAQVSGGVQHELACVIRTLSDALDAQRLAAADDRTGKERGDAPETSRAAASLVVKSGTQRHNILRSLLQRGDQTDYELQQNVGIAESSERPRRGELVDAGFVTATRLTREHRGREFQIWTLTKLGHDLILDLDGLPPAGSAAPITTLF